MPGGMAGREYHAHHAIIEEIIIIRVLAAEVSPLEAGPVKISTNIGRGGKPIGCERVFPFGALHDVDGIRKSADRASMVEVKVGLQHITHVFRLDADRRQLRDAVLVPLHYGIVGRYDVTPMGTRIDGHLGGVAAVDDDVALWMADEEPGHGDIIIGIAAFVNLYLLELGAHNPRLEHMQLYRSDAPMPGRRAGQRDSGSSLVKFDDFNARSFTPLPIMARPTLRPTPNAWQGA